MPEVTDETVDEPAAQRFSTADETEREAGIANAALAVQRGQLVVLPTDTVYGIGADAFDAEAVSRLLAAKGRGREMPPPVLVSPRSHWSDGCWRQTRVSGPGQSSVIRARA